jgi:hypothetical protein
MEPERTLPHLQPPATCSCTEPDQSSPVDTSPSHFLNTHFNSILPSTPRTSKWSLSLRCPQEILCAPLLSSRRATCPSNLILLDSVNQIFREDYRSWSSSSCSLRYFLVTLSLLVPDIFLSTHFSNALDCCSLSVRDQASHPYKTTGKITVLHIRIFGQHTGRWKILNRTITSIPWLESALNFFMIGILIC